MTAKILWTAAEAQAATNGMGPDHWRATGVSIDTRSVAAGDLFVALSGPNHDAHAFVAEALAKGGNHMFDRRMRVARGHGIVRDFIGFARKPVPVHPTALNMMGSQLRNRLVNQGPCPTEGAAAAGAGQKASRAKAAAAFFMGHALPIVRKRGLVERKGFVDKP